MKKSKKEKFNILAWPISAFIVSGLLIICNPLPLKAQAVINETTVTATESEVQLSNNIIAIKIDLKKGTYAVLDKKENLLLLSDARLSADGWNSSWVYGGHNEIGKQKIGWQQKSVVQFNKKGKRIELSFTGSTKLLPEYRFAFTLMNGASSVELQAGIKNALPGDCRLMKAELFSNATLFPGAKISALQTLNGAAGVTMPKVLGDTSRESTNSMLLTALVDGKRRSIVWGGLRYQYYYANTLYQKDKHCINLFMIDPVGRLVKQNEEWWAPDTYYLGVGEDNPFLALEQYGLALREANNAKPNVYDFPTLCGWAVGNLSGGKDINNSAALINEMDEANKCGLTKYTKVAVRLEPDSYCYTDGNTEQGWWDDEHWSKFGHLVKPYETFAKWCSAVKERNGVPLTYFQAGMPSDDFARAHPEWMLGNDISQLHLYHRHHQPNVRYDYTDKGFQAHTLSMWQRLRKDGMAGIKFDYPETAWNPQGGYDDPLATTTSSYTTLFRLCREGLGPEARIHERNLGESGRPTLDVTAGIVDIQRTAWDNNQYEAQFVTTGGLRWYKSRSVFYYYPDSKAIHPLNAETRQSLLTMLALTSGRLELATPFAMLTPEMVKDISRIYPMYAGLKSPRPIDAFTGKKDPGVYDLELTPDWHQLAIFNSEKEQSIVTVKLHTAMVDGGLALDSTAEYYVYDFWRDSFKGKMEGDATIHVYLNALACEMFSVRKVQAVPQLLSTNRHILQGWIEIKDMQWNDAKKTLAGKAAVVAGEPFKIVIAANKWKLMQVKSNASSIKWENHPQSDDLKLIIIENNSTQDVEWSVTFKK
ncbi:MAG: hypothetical protein V4722_12925 [Bacteroidota bacterium]